MTLWFTALLRQRKYTLCMYSNIHNMCNKTWTKQSGLHSRHSLVHYSFKATGDLRPIVVVVGSDGEQVTCWV